MHGCNINLQQVAELASLAQLLPPCSPTCVIRRRTALRQSCCSRIAYASAAAHHLCLLQLLLPDCVRFNCSPIASASAAARHLCLLQLLLATCVCFSCYSLIASVSTAPRLRPLRLLLLDCVHRKFNCYSGFTCSSPIACASAAAPRLRPLRLLLPDCVRLTLVASPVLEDSSQCSRTFSAEFEVQ